MRPRYEIVPPDEDTEEKDLQFGSYWLRPVPEPRPVEELTYQEIIDAVPDVEDTPISSVSAHELIEFTKRLDEIRSRPRETEKEKWIRNKLNQITVKSTPVSDKQLLSDTWDAAYEAGRKGK